MEEAEKALASSRICTSRGGWAVPCFFGDVAFVNEYAYADEDEYDPEDPFCLQSADSFSTVSFLAEAIEDRRADEEEENEE